MLFAVKNIAIQAPYEKVMEYLSDATKLPEWTNAFASVKPNGEAIMKTPEGEIPVKLRDIINEKAGTIDSEMTFPDGSVGVAYSRLIELDKNSCAYSFLLTPPPAPLEKLEGALKEQADILEQELVKLKAIMEK